MWRGGLKNGISSLRKHWRLSCGIERIYGFRIPCYSNPSYSTPNIQTLNTGRLRVHTIGLSTDEVAGVLLQLWNRHLCCERWLRQQFIIKRGNYEVWRLQAATMNSFRSTLGTKWIRNAIDFMPMYKARPRSQCCLPLAKYQLISHQYRATRQGRSWFRGWWVGCPFLV